MTWTADSLLAYWQTVRATWPIIPDAITAVPGSIDPGTVQATGSLYPDGLAHIDAIASADNHAIWHEAGHIWQQVERRARGLDGSFVDPNCPVGTAFWAARGFPGKYGDYFATGSWGTLSYEALAECFAAVNLGGTERSETYGIPLDAPKMLAFFKSIPFQPPPAPVPTPPAPVPSTSLSPLSRSAGELIAAGLPPSPVAALVFGAQTRIETADGAQMFGNNPLNLRPIPGGWPGQAGVSPGGFAMFDTLVNGCAACAANYNAPEYSGVRAALSGTADELAAAIEASPWDSGHYGYGNLRRLVAELEGNVTDDELRAALKRIYAGPDSLEEWVKADVRVMVEQDPGTRAAIVGAVKEKLG